MVRGWDRLGGCSVQTTAAGYLANLHGVHIIYSQGSTLLYLFLSLLPGSVAAAVLNCFSLVQVSFSNSRPNPDTDITLSSSIQPRYLSSSPSSASQWRLATWLRKTSAGMATFCLPLSTSQSGRDILPAPCTG